MFKRGAKRKKRKRKKRKEDRKERGGSWKQKWKRMEEKRWKLKRRRAGRWGWEDTLALEQSTAKPCAPALRHTHHQVARGSPVLFPSEASSPGGDSSSSTSRMKNGGHVTPVRMEKINKAGNHKCWRGCGLLVGCELVHPLWKIMWRFLKELKK